MKAFNLAAVFILLSLSASMAFSFGLKDIQDGLGALVGQKEKAKEKQDEVPSVQPDSSIASSAGGDSKTARKGELTAKDDTVTTTTADAKLKSDKATDDLAAQAMDPKQVELLELVDQQEQIVQSYIMASLKLTEAQILMAKALGLKKDAAKLEDSAKVFGEGKVATKSGLKKHHKTSIRTNKAIERKLKKKKQLSEESQKLFILSLKPYANGLKKTRKVYDDAKPFFVSVAQKISEETLSIKSSGFNLTSVIEKTTKLVRTKSEPKKKLATSVYLVTAAPKFMGNHGKTIEKIMNYSESQNIKVPQDTVALLDDLDL